MLATRTLRCATSTTKHFGPQFRWAEPTPQDQRTHPAAEVFDAGVRHHHSANTAYPIAHAETLSTYRLPRTPDQRHLHQGLLEAYGPLQEMMLYVHVPFCAQRCQFCEYTVVDPVHGKRDDVQEQYFDALLGEFELYRQLLHTEEKRLVGFDIGGGTPSMASSRNIARVVQKASECFDFDPEAMRISIETTPQIAATDPQKLRDYYQMGIRRISMGVQTTDFALANRLGREDGSFLEAARDNIRTAGFDSFNVDLMYGFPVRDAASDSWGDTVRSAIEVLDPEHITLYRMRYKGTKMAHLQERVGLEQVHRQADTAAGLLKERGYHGWVGKNTFSRVPGDSGCSDYLEKRVVQGVPYLGLGLGAQSFTYNTLAYNLGGVTKRMGQYMKSVQLGRIPVQDLYHLSLTGAMGKFCSVSFYFGSINTKHFQQNFGMSLEEAYGDKVQFVLEQGLMEHTGDRLAMTPKGKAHYGGVLALFYAPHVQEHLLRLPGGEPGAAAYMSEGHQGGQQRKPYEGNPVGRYEKRKKRKPRTRDPRPALDGDWEEPTSAAAGI